MITGFDHVVIAVRDLAAGVAAYETLLGRAMVHRSQREGADIALIATDNIAVELMAPTGEGEAATRLRAALEAGEGLKSLVFATHDLAGLHRRAERVGLAPEAIIEREDYASFRFNTERTNGVRFFALQRSAQITPSTMQDAGVSALDHIVIRSANFDRGAALFGARLGLDMRLDREAIGRRLMFFRCGDAIVEIAQFPDEQMDSFGGFLGVSRTRRPRASVSRAPV